MIKLQEYTPEIYYKQSRDFQYIGRLYDLVLNSVKTNTDMIYDIPSSDAAGSKMIDLLTLTLGFKPRHAYNVKQLAAICSILPTILRNKGTLKAVKMACQALLTAEGITDLAEITAGWEEVQVVEDLGKNTFKIIIYMPPALSDLALLIDLLSYILPAGISCEIYRAIKITTPIPTTLIDTTDSITTYLKEREYDTDIVGVSVLTRGQEDLVRPDGTFDSVSEHGVIMPDKNFRSPITNSTIIREPNDTTNNNDDED